MSRPLVSVIVPAFRAQTTIRRCIQSLADPLLPPGSVEVLVEPDDGTSYDWLSAIGPHVKPAQGNHARTGPGPTRNRALCRAKGEWITYIDADDHVAPGYIARLLNTARPNGAALAQTRIVRQGRHVFHFGDEATPLDFEDWARSGVSVRGLFHRSAFPDFIDEPAQDILHIVECMLLSGRNLDFSTAVYFLTLGENTVTAQPGFADRVAVAYGRHIDYLRAHYSNAPLLPDAVAFWHAKAKLNRNYLKYRDSLSYYEFVARQG